MPNDKVCTQDRFELSNMTITLGTVDFKKTKSFYIVVSGWLSLTDISIIPKLKRDLNVFIKSISFDVLPKNILYSFIDLDFPENLEKTRNGFFALETTFLLKNEITDFKTNELLKTNSIAFGELIQLKLTEFSDISFSRRRIR